MKYEPPYGAPGADDPYVNGDPTIARQGSIIPGAAVEYPQREIVHLIEKSNFTPTDDDLYQLTEGVRSQFVNFCVDTGAANALSVALNPPLVAYKQGLPLRVLVSQNNTGPTTINVNGIGNRAVVRSSGSQLEANDLRSGMIASLVDDGTRFQLTNSQALGGGGGGTVNNYAIKIPYVQDTGTVNAIVAPFSPAITTVSAGDPILVRIANVNTGAVTIAVNGIAAAPVRRNDGQPLQARDLILNEVLLMVYNLTFWQIVRFVRSQIGGVKLTADLTLYVRPDGDDTHDGSANDAAHAFKTVQGAINFVKASFLIAGRTVTLQLGIPGNYTGADILVDNIPGSIVIRGDPANWAAYVILGNPTSAGIIGCKGSGSTLQLIGINVSNQNSGISPNTCNMISAYNQGFISVSNIGLSGTWTDGAGIAAFSAQVELHDLIDVTTAGMRSLLGAYDGAITAGAWNTVINIHGIAFHQAFAIATYSYYQIPYNYLTFAGSATGPRYQGYLNSAFNTNGGPANYFPGSSNGSLDASSVYG